ncbi:hypothetical protein [Halorussus aquaticus]|uniref:Uncharacterized protein n=1 Tax=Halorussus aquaticus TaxID=2953748 RepID=A0ABD5PZ46_9EURY|nr:hypothetical protein [Halorussus aquaticus]
MIWQDLVFSLGTSLPSAALGVVYGASFYNVGIAFSASGALSTGVLWAGIAGRRSLSISAPLSDEVAAVRARLSDYSVGRGKDLKSTVSRPITGTRTASFAV